MFDIVRPGRLRRTSAVGEALFLRCKRGSHVFGATDALRHLIPCGGRPQAALAHIVQFRLACLASCFGRAREIDIEIGQGSSP